MSIETYLREQGERVENWLDECVPTADAPPARLHEAVRYSLLGGGKRLRPVLCLVSGEMFDAREQTLMPVACALEMIHTYSLIHDDLPSMDDDDLRRGRSTCHKVFGEAIAILAGDALLTRAFGLLAETGVGDASRRLAIVRRIAEAAGFDRGMVAGQALDLEAQGSAIDAAELDRLHAAKTGALLRASIVAGALCGTARDEDVEALDRFGSGLGLAFQIADDVLDVTSTAEALGKTPGKDISAHKATYPALFGIEGSVTRAKTLIDNAIAELERFGPRADRLREIACFTIQRQK